MKHLLQRNGSRDGGDPGFTIIEAVFGMSIIGMTAVAMFSGLSTGFYSMQMARENMRATQILLEKAETFRLYSWDQVLTPGFIPTSFTSAYDPSATNSSSRGTVYTGSLVITNVAFTNEYSPNMRKLTVTVNWQTGSLPRTRSYSTFISQNGLQTYIY